MTVTIDAGETSTADLSAYLPLLARLRNGARLQPDWSALVDDAVQVWARPGFDTFLALPASCRREPSLSPLNESPSTRRVVAATTMTPHMPARRPTATPASAEPQRRATGHS